MTNREELIQELEQAPDDIVQSVLDFFRRVKATSKTHPLGKFAGILSDVEAEELKRAMSDDKPSFVLKLPRKWGNPRLSPPLAGRGWWWGSDGIKVN